MKGGSIGDVKFVCHLLPIKIVDMVSIKHVS